MRIATPKELGALVRSRRRDLGMSQAALAADALVSRRWLSDLENGKSTAEVGLTLRLLSALRLTLDISPTVPIPGAVDLDEVLRQHTRAPRTATE